MSPFPLVASPVGEPEVLQRTYAPGTPRYHMIERSAAGRPVVQRQVDHFSANPAPVAVTAKNGSEPAFVVLAHAPCYPEARGAWPVYGRYEAEK